MSEHRFCPDCDGAGEYMRETGNQVQPCTGICGGKSGPLPPDMVNAPPHYTSSPSGVECIEVTEHMNFCVGNAVKYLWRAGEKNDLLEDLKKARWYIDREIARVEKERAKEAPAADPGAGLLRPKNGEGWDPFFIPENAWNNQEYSLDRWRKAAQVFVILNDNAGRLIVKSRLDCDAMACTANLDTIARRRSA